MSIRECQIDYSSKPNRLDFYELALNTMYIEMDSGQTRSISRFYAFLIQIKKKIVCLRTANERMIRIHSFTIRQHSLSLFLFCSHGINDIHSLVYTLFPYLIFIINSSSIMLLSKVGKWQGHVTERFTTDVNSSLFFLSRFLKNIHVVNLIHRTQSISVFVFDAYRQFSFSH